MTPVTDNDIKTLRTLLTQKCAYYKHSCVEIFNKCYDFDKRKYKFPQDLIDLIALRMIKDYSYTCDHSYGTNKGIGSIKRFDLLMLLSKHGQIKKSYGGVCINQKLSPPDLNTLLPIMVNYTKFSSSFIIYSMSTKKLSNETIVLLLKNTENGFKYKTDLMKHALLSYNDAVVGFLLDKDVLIDNILLKDFYKNLNYSSNILQLLIKRKIKIDNLDIDQICENNNSPLLEYYLSLGNDISSAQVLKLCQCRDYQSLFHLANSRYVFKQEHFQGCISGKFQYRSSRNSQNGNIVPCLKLMIENGYRPDSIDVDKMLESKTKLSCFSDYDFVKKDINLLRSCYKHDNYPFGIFMNPDEKCLEYACTNRTLPKIKELIHTYNIKPTIKCLENSCNFKSNVVIIRFLMKKGLKPNLKCIKNIADCLNNKSLIEMLEVMINPNNVQIDDKDKGKQIKKNIKKVKKIINKVVSDSESEEESDSESEEESDSESEEESDSDSDNYKKTKKKQKKMVCDTIDLTD